MNNFLHLTPSLLFHVSLSEQEMQELKKQLKDTSVVAEMDNNRQLNMEQVVKEVKSQYEEVSAHSRQEAEAWYKNKVMAPCHYTYTLRDKGYIFTQV